MINKFFLCYADDVTLFYLHFTIVYFEFSSLSLFPVVLVRAVLVFPVGPGGKQSALSLHQQLV